MMLTEWKNRVKTIFKESEVPYYPEVQELPSSPVSIDVAAIEQLLNWSSTASPEEVSNAVAKITDLSQSGEFVDINLVNDIVAHGDYGDVMSAPQPIDMAPTVNVDNQPADTFDPQGVGAESPEGEPVIVPEVPSDLEIAGDSEVVGDPIEEPLVGDEEEEEDIKKNLFKSFF